MLDIGGHHENYSLRDPRDIQALSGWRDEPEIQGLAQRLLTKQTDEVRAELFDALVELDRRVYMGRKTIGKTFNPYR